MANKTNLPPQQNEDAPYLKIVESEVEGVYGLKEALPSGSGPLTMTEDIDSPDDLVASGRKAGAFSSEELADSLQRALPNPRKKRQELFLPVHGFVWFFPEEMQVIDHPSFQRLEGLHQLGLAHLVYRGATHRRLEHSLGTVHVVQRMISSVEENCAVISELDPGDKWDLGCPLSQYEKRFIRLAALLHDIGHVAFGHTFEDELNLLNKHDERERVDKIFQKTDWWGTTVQSLEALVNEHYRDFVPPGLSDTPSELTKRILLYKPIELLPEAEKVNTATSNNKEEREQRETGASSDRVLAARGFRIAVCGDMVGNTICADLLDYIHRDWYHLGVPKPVVDRIYQYMAIRVPRNSREQGQKGYALPTAEDRFVISLGNNSNFRSDGVTAIVSLLESRYELVEAVIFHRAKMTMTAMLERALTLALPSQAVGQKSGPGMTFRAQLEDWLIDHTEEELLPALREGRKPFVGKGLSDEDKAGIPVAAGIASKLLRRDLYDRLSTYTAADEPRYADNIQQLYGNNEDAAANRNAALRRLEQDFALPLGSVAMYCPDSRMNLKIAKVRVFVEGEVYRIDQYESARRTENALSRGHLTAQLRRFDGLWRTTFLIDPVVYASKSAPFWSLFKDAIWYLVLGIRRDETFEAKAAQLAHVAVNVADFHLYNSEPTSLPKIKYARNDPNARAQEYPTEAPSLLLFIN